MDLARVRRAHGGYWRYPHVDFHYLPKLANSYPSGQHVLAELLARWKDEPYFAAENLVVGNGSSELIKLLNDQVLSNATIPLPTFNEFIARPSRRLHRYALREEEDFRLDVDRLLQEVRRSASEYVVLVNPNNPVGNIVELADIRRILEAGVTLVVDEAFIDFANPSYSAEPLVPDHDNLVIVKSLTKSAGIAGLRLGYVLTANSRIKRILREALPIWNVNSLAEYVIEAFPRYRTQHRESLQRIIAETRWFYDALQEIPYLTPFPTHTNAVFCRVNGSASRLAELLFDRHGFVVKDGIRQAELTTVHGYVRMGLRNREDNGKLLAALHAISSDEITERSGAPVNV
jgi:threonine-phosphate decarboxylase